MKYDHTLKPQRGYRAEVNILRELSTVIERNPWMPRPSFSIGLSAGRRTMINVNVWSPVPGAEGDTDLARMKDTLRALRRAFGGGVWKKNDPSSNSFAETYYELTREWNGATVVLSAYRSKVCQMTVREEEYTEEVPDPNYVADVPTITVTRTRKVTEWHCNEPVESGADQGYGVNLKVVQ